MEILSIRLLKYGAVEVQTVEPLMDVDGNVVSSKTWGVSLDPSASIELLPENIRDEVQSVRDVWLTPERIASWENSISEE